MSNVVIGCRLPNGLILELPGKPPVELAGQRQAQEGRAVILLSKDDCGYTEVEESFWQEWQKRYQGFEPLEKSAIFEAKNRTEAKGILKEVKDEPTGHEPLSQTVPGISKSE